MHVLFAHSDRWSMQETGIIDFGTRPVCPHLARLSLTSLGGLSESAGTSAVMGTFVNNMIVHRALNENVRNTPNRPKLLAGESGLGGGGGELILCRGRDRCSVQVSAQGGVQTRAPQGKNFRRDGSSLNLRKCSADGSSLNCTLQRQAECDN